MAVCGLVLTLNPETSEATLAHLRSESSLTIGAPNGSRWPAVLEIDGEEDGADELRRLSEFPGVVGLELVCVHYEGDQPLDEARTEYPT